MQKVELNIPYTHLVIERRRRLEELRAQRRSEDPNILSAYGYKIFCQSDEDGIIAEIFRRIGTTSNTFIEIGSEDGMENNTVTLLYGGWSGAWIEADQNACKFVADHFTSAIASGQLSLVNATVTINNVNQIIEQSGYAGKEIDLLSVDIDGNDAYILRAITAVNARVVIAEYNGKFGPTIDYCMKYDESYNWHNQHGDGFGASLKHLEILMDRKGYSLVGCSLVGTNAFFVRKDLTVQRYGFKFPFTSAAHWEPCRFELSFLHVGHDTHPDTFERAVLKRCEDSK